MEKYNKKILFAAWSCHNKNYFAYQTWHRPLKNLFKHFITFDPQEYTYHHGRDAMNRAFLELVKKEQPDYIFLWLIYDEFYLETLEKIKQFSPHTRTINFFGDDDVLFDVYTRYYSLFIDYPLASHQQYLKKYKEEGIRNMFFSCGVDTQVLKPLQVRKKYDVTFIGTPKNDRVDYLRHLKKNGIKIDIYGGGWQAYPEFKEDYHGKISQDEATQVINESKINLSFTKNSKDIPGFKARVFEISACKSFLLSEYFSGYTAFLKEDKEIVMFKNKEDLLKKVKFYLKNERKREKISERSYKKVIADYSQQAEFERFFKGVTKLDKKYAPKTLPKISGRVLTLSLDDFRDPLLRERVQTYDFVTFMPIKGSVSKYREYFQAYSLEKTKKEISCCDYYIDSPGLGNYLSFFAGHAFKEIERKEFLSLLDISHLMVRKEYFVKNFERFRSFNKSKEHLIDESKITFVGIPLVSLRKRLLPLSHAAEKFIMDQFENELRRHSHQRKIFFSPYTYRLLLQGITNKYVLKKMYVHLKKKIAS